ncbi:MAG: DNA repair protein [Candidatus Bipolaricaulia bacterium]
MTESSATFGDDDRSDEQPPAGELASPQVLRRRVDGLAWQYEEQKRQAKRVKERLSELDRYLAISGKVTTALEQLSEQLFRQLLDIVQEKLTVALQEILEQPIKFHAEVEFKRNRAVVEFWMERNGNQEDVLHGQGGSVANILSVGLRIFALATLDENEHRRFLILDEQDCWLRPDLVPRLVKIVHDAGKALGFQVLMISHHDIAAFDRYADKIYRLTPVGDGAVEVQEVTVSPTEEDSV